MPYPGVGKTWSKLALIANHAKRDSSLQFTCLYHLLDVEFLKDCYNSLNRNKAVGVDEVSWADYGIKLDENIWSLRERIRRRSYKPIPAKRVYIPKSETEKRPLGISALENKIVERGLTWILESIYEQDFLECSYGFRPKRSSHQALKDLNDMIMNNPVNHVVEADIRKFFDKVSHEELMKFLHVRIKDPRVLELIGKFLKAGYIDDNLLVRPEEGTPQGSILSPLLANIFLHYVLDVWFNTVVKEHVAGFCGLIRYADDFVCVIQYESDAKRIEKALKSRFNKYGLEIHPEKSRRISFGRYEKQKSRKQNRHSNVFTFLGFTHFCDITRKGKFKVGRKTSRKKFAMKCKEMNDWLREVRNSVRTSEWWKTLVSKLRGHYQYYGVSENTDGISRYYERVKRLVHKWLNRRSQRGKMSWDKFNIYLKRYPLPEPRIMHSYYTWSSVAR